MHQITKNKLETLHCWIEEVMRADHYAVELERAIPENSEDGITANVISPTFGDLELHLHGAAGVDEAAPYLRAARQLGFERQGDGRPEEQPANNRVVWKFEVNVGRGDDVLLPDRIQLAVVLNLPRGEDGATAATCQYVQVGTKTVPDMKLMCGEELAAWKREHEELPA